MRGKKGRNYISRQALRPFFPLIIFILLCFNVLSTVPRENRLADFLYIYIYILVYRLRNEYESNIQSNEHYLSSIENKA